MSTVRPLASREVAPHRPPEFAAGVHDAPAPVDGACAPADPVWHRTAPGESLAGAPAAHTTHRHTTGETAAVVCRDGGAVGVVTSGALARAAETALGAPVSRRAGRRPHGR